MGGQRRYYLSALQDLLARAKSDENDEAPSGVPAPETTPTPAPPKRERTVWDEVEEEKASFEALKIRSQRDIFVRSQQADEELAQQERSIRLDAERRESQARAAQAAAALQQQQALDEHHSRVKFELSLAELRLALEPPEAHGAIRRALLLLLTPEHIPVGTPPARISQVVNDEIKSAAAPFKKVLGIRADAMKYAERALSKGDLDYFEKSRLRESIESELAARLTPDWTPRRAERLVDFLLSDIWPDDD